MKLSITITQIAHQPKILPLNKIIKSSAFTVKQLSQNAFISKEDENIRPTEVGTIVDYLSRYVLLADEHAFDVANDKAKQDLIHEIIPVKEYKKLLDQEERLGYLVKDLSDVDSLSDEAIYLATDICAWEDAFRSGRYVKPKVHPDKLTTEHIKMMIQRVEEFFEEFGWPIRDAFFAKTENGFVSGDGDYLLKHTLLDLKVSVQTTMQISWVRQLLLYYTLGFYNHFNNENIERLMIFNARTNTVFFIDIADIDPSVFEFVYDAAEKQSKINERELRKYIN